MADTQLNKLLQKTNTVQTQEERLNRIQEDLNELNKKLGNLNKEDEKRIEQLKEQIKLIQKEGSLKQQKELIKIFDNVKKDFEDLKSNIKSYKDNINLEFINLNEDFIKTQKETQLLMDAKLKEIGDFVGEKIDVAVKFIGSSVKNVLLNVTNYIDSKISYLLNNFTSLLKNAFSTLKNAILHPIETLKNLPSLILDKVKSGIMFVFNTIKAFIVGTIKFAFNLVVGTIKFAFKAVIGVVKGAIWAFTKVFEGLYFLVRSAFKIIYFIASKILSFVISVVWGLLKTVGKFVVTFIWNTLKMIATSVAKVLWSITKTLVQTIVIAITSAFAPWLGLIALIGVGIYLLGKFFGWWGGEPNSSSASGASVKKGGFFSGFADMISGWWDKISDFFWKGDGTGIIEKAFQWLWNKDNKSGVLQKFFGITTTFSEWIWNKLKEFWDWVLKGAKVADPFQIRDEQISKIDKSLENIDLAYTELLKRQDDYTKELNELKSISEPTPEQIKRKNELQSAISSIKDRFGEFDNRKSILQTEKAKINSYSKEELADKSTGLIDNLVSALTEWWSKPKGAKDTLIEWLVGDPTKAGSKGLFTWIEEKIKQGWNYIQTFITGNGNWDSPDSKSLLGKFYDIIFGESNINWKTNSGLLGTFYYYLNETKLVILKSIDLALDYSSKILESLTNLSLMFKESVLFGDSAVKFANLLIETNANLESKRKGSLQESLKETTSASFEYKKAALQQSINKLNRKNISTEELQQKTILETRLKELTQNNEKTKETFDITKNPEEKRLAFTSLNNLLRFSIFAAAEENGTFMSSNIGWDAIRDKLISHFGKYNNEFSKLKIPLWYNDNPTNDSEKQKFLTWLQDKNNTTQILKDFEKLNSTGSLFFPEEKNSIEKMKQKVEGFFSIAEQKNYDFDKVYNWNKSTAGVLWADYMSKPGFFGLLGRSVSEEQTKPITEGFFGFASGGIIKPPSESEKGRIINVAEAGNPEIVIPLTKEGLTYIKQISDTVQPIEINNTITKPEKVKKEETQPIKNIPYPYVASREIEKSDRTELDVLRLVSLGFLTK